MFGQMSITCSTLMAHAVSVHCKRACSRVRRASSETAHPAKFKDTVENIIGEAIQIPEKLQAFMRGEKKSLPMSKDFADFKRYLMNI